MLLSRLYVAEICGSLRNVMSLFSRRCECTWDVFKVSDPEECYANLLWASKRPKSQMTLAGEVLPPLHEMTPALWAHYHQRSLTSKEATELGFYIQRRGTGIVCSLDQGESRDRGVASTVTKLHTQIRNNGVQWDVDSSYILTPTDILASQGFPTKPDFSGGVACSSFCTPRTRGRTATSGQGGNSMNTDVCGKVLIASLMFVRRTEELPLEEILGLHGLSLSQEATSNVEVEAVKDATEG